MSGEIFDKVRNLIADIEAATPTTADEVEIFRRSYLGSKNKIKPLFAEMRNVENSQKKDFGLLLNAAKQRAEVKYSQAKQQLESERSEHTDLDLTVPGLPLPVGLAIRSPL